MSDLERAKELLRAGGYTCVLCRNGEIYSSVERGVRPLVAYLADGRDYGGFCAADRVVGKATAFLYVLLGIRAVAAQVISRSALQVLTEHRIVTEYETLAEHIVNRRGDGICPFEETVMRIDDPADAYRAILEKMAELRIAP